MEKIIYVLVFYLGKKLELLTYLMYLGFLPELNMVLSTCFDVPIVPVESSFLSVVLITSRLGADKSMPLPLVRALIQ